MTSTEVRTHPTRQAPLLTLLLASAVSQIGDAMALVALPWFVLQTTGSPTLTGLAGAMTVLPALLAGLLGGVLVDRLGPWQTSILADVVSGVAIAAIPLFYATVGLPFPALMVLVLLGSLLAVPSLTACRALLPELADLAGVTRERANAAFESLQHLAFLLGPPLAGVLIGFVGAPGVLAFDALSFVAAAALVAIGVPRVTLPRPTGPWSYREELLAGLQFLCRDRLLVAIALCLAATNFLGNTLFSVVLPVYTTTVTGRAADLGLMVAADGGGALLGIALYGLWGGGLPRRAVWLAGYAAFAAMLWVLTLRPPMVVMVAALGLAGVIGGPLNPLSVTVRQERIPPALRGRVFSAFSAIAMASSPLGIVGAGVLTEQYGLPTTLLVLAVGYTLICAAMWVAPVLHELNRAPSLPDAP